MIKSITQHSYFEKKTQQVSRELGVRSVCCRLGLGLGFQVVVVGGLESLFVCLGNLVLLLCLFSRV
jgi:hypothetical protein